MKRSKKYREAATKVENKFYSLDDASKLVTEISYTKFPGSVLARVKLNLNDKQKKEAIRGSYALPNNFGKVVKVLAFVDPQNAKNVGDADFVGGEELIKDVEDGKLDFDLVVATPLMMPKIAKLGKTLGSKGLMPNPKNGTVTTDVAKTVAVLKSGQRNFKVGENNIVEAVVAKVDMDSVKISDNAKTFIQAVVNEAKRFSSNPLKEVTIAPTMGPALKIELTSVA